MKVESEISTMTTSAFFSYFRGILLLYCSGSHFIRIDHLKDIMYWLLFFAGLPLIIGVSWRLVASHINQNTPLTNKRILLLIAHPDDEAMFFAPTLLSITQPALQNHVRILCLSQGNIGEIRKHELVKSALHLGIKSEDDVTVLNDDRFRDSMVLRWDRVEISRAIQQHVTVNKGSDINVDIIITFDDKGVSAHANHISLYHGATRFIQNINGRQTSLEKPIELWTLATVDIVRKYISMLDIAFTMLINTPSKTTMVFVNTPNLFIRAQQAMTDCHQSQMLWFRWSWIALSRYMTVNHLNRQMP